MLKHPNRDRTKLLAFASILFTIALINVTAPAAQAQTPTATDVLVMDAGDVNVKARGARLVIPAAWREYTVKTEYEISDGENSRYRRVILYIQTGQSNCLRELCWKNHQAFALNSDTHEMSFRRADLNTLLVTAWGFDSNNPNSKGGAPYAGFRTERITVNGKRGVKLTFSSTFGAGNTIVTLFPNR